MKREEGAQLQNIKNVFIRSHMAIALWLINSQVKMSLTLIKLSTILSVASFIRVSLESLKLQTKQRKPKNNNLQVRAN